MVKKEVFEWLQSGQKTIELRRGKSKQGDRKSYFKTKEVNRNRTRSSHN